VRPEERCAAERLKAFFETNGHIVSYKPGPDPHAPPDIVFRADEATWGVEHTQLFQYVEGGNGELSRLDVTKPLCDRLKEQLLQETKGERKSSWRFFLLGPLNPKQLRAIKQAAKWAILKDDPSYFEDFQTDEVKLKRVQDDACTIYVICGLSASSRIPGSNRLTADIQGEIDYTISRILRQKGLRLEALSGYDKRVLLIDSEYFFADPANVAQAIRSSAALSSGWNLIFLITYKSVTKVGGLDEKFS